MKIKKLFCFLIISCLILPITSCSNNVPRLLLEDAEITLWTYPIGDWGNKTVVNKLIKSFNEVHPDISVKVKYLDYTSGDNEVEEAVKSGKTPDIILEGPEIYQISTLMTPRIYTKMWQSPAVHSMVNITSIHFAWQLIVWL